MNQKRKHINNPLTLITIFCGISIASLYSIKYVNPELQHIFIYFVIGFTSLLTFFTFIILLVKPQVLYAPSDFKDEENFLVTLKLNKKIEKKRVSVK